MSKYYSERYVERQTEKANPCLEDKYGILTAFDRCLSGEIDIYRARALIISVVDMRLFYNKHLYYIEDIHGGLMIVSHDNENLCNEYGNFPYDKVMKECPAWLEKGNEQHKRYSFNSIAASKNGYQELSLC